MKPQSETGLPWRRARACWCRLFATIAVCAIPGAVLAAEAPYVTVRTQTVTRQIEAYGQVQPIAVVRVKAPAAGIASDFALLPGAAVKPGDVIARLTGPEVDSAMIRSQAAVKSATAKRAAAEQALEALRAQLESHLSTAQQVAQAEADVADATGALAAATAGREAARLTATILSPVGGRIIALNAAAGERVAAGDPLVTIEPADRLWITAVLYGTDAATVRLGQAATFTPASAGAPLAVEVVSIAPTIAGAGDVTVGLRATPADATWRSGEYGQVEFHGVEEHLVAVPTQALILDRGKWWVLVHRAEGDQPVEVVPGTSQGWQTFVRSGLAAGTEIVAQNAYLEFHREIARRYQPPD